MPLPVPTRPCDSVSIDFITNLPNVDGYEVILTHLLWYALFQKWLILFHAIQRLTLDNWRNYFGIMCIIFMDYLDFIFVTVTQGIIVISSKTSC